MTKDKQNLEMQPIIELIWSPEEEVTLSTDLNVACMAPQCGGVGGLWNAAHCAPPGFRAHAAC